MICVFVPLIQTHQISTEKSKQPSKNEIKLRNMTNESKKNLTLSLAGIATTVISGATLMMLVSLIPLTQNFIDDSKLYILFITALISGLLFAVSIIKRGAIELILSKLTFVTLLFLISISASTFFTNDYPVKAILGFGGAFLAAGVTTLFLAPILSKNSKKWWMISYVVGVMAVVFASILELLSITLFEVKLAPSSLLPLFGPFISPSPSILFNLSGSIANAFQLSLLGIVGIVSTWWFSKKAKPAQLVALIFLLIGAGIFGFHLLPGRTPIQTPSLAASWSVALDSIRDPRSALIGVGPGSYASTYQQFKPYWLNNTPQWSLVFASGFNTPLTLLTTTGFLGLFTWLALFIFAIIEFRKSSKEEKPIGSMLISAFVLQFFFQPSVVIIAIHAFLTALFIAGRRQDVGVLHFTFFHTKLLSARQDTNAQSHSPKWPIYLTSGLIVAGVSLSAYYLANFYLAFHNSFLAEIAAQNDDAQKVYDLRMTAVRLNPYLDILRRDYALTSIAIAEIIANRTDKTQADEQLVGQLIQQAVREAQAADQLDPRNAQNAAVLANIYQRLIGTVEGADGFAEQFFVKAINLYPTAPDLYVSLAGVYFNREQWQTALNILNQALQVKNDYPNTIFNFAFASEKLGAFEQALTAYEAVIGFIQDTESEDYKSIQAKIEELKPIVEKLRAEREQQQQQGANAQSSNTATPSASTQAPSAGELNLNSGTQTQDVEIAPASLPEATLPPAQTTPLSSELSEPPASTDSSEPTANTP